jgi:truncated hemoglobin YjbI
MTTPTLYDWAGGADAFRRLTEVFYRRVRADDVLGPVFAHMPPEHPQHVATWFAEVFGGPSAYTEDHGGYAHMLSKHLGMAITEVQRFRWVSLIAQTPTRRGCPPIRSSGLPSWPTWSGAPGSRWATPNPRRRRRCEHPCHVGDGVRRCPTQADGRRL